MRAFWLLGRARGCEDGEQLADPLVTGERVREWQVGVDEVAVASTGAVARYVAGVGQLGDDAVGGSFGDADALADVAQSHTRLFGDADEDLGVISEEGPAWLWRGRHK